MGTRKYNPNRMKRRKTALYRGRKQRPCVWCGKMLWKHEATIEHMKPKAEGGSDIIDNLNVSCLKCNNARGNFMVRVYKGRITREQAEQEFSKWVAAKQKRERS